jgi:hypothetical protein
MSVVPSGTQVVYKSSPTFSAPSDKLDITPAVLPTFSLFSWASFPLWKSVRTFHDPILVLICVRCFVIRYPPGFRFFVDFLKTFKNFSMGR